MHWVFRGENPHGNVVINFRGNPVDELAPFAHGYRDAGKKLARELPLSGYRDLDGYPILFLFRHALELYMKAVVYRGAQLARVLDSRTIDTAKLFKTHNLSRLLPGLAAVLETMGWQDDFQTPHIHDFAEFSDLVRGIDEIDSDSSSFRYPVTSKGRPAVSHHSVVNALAFAEHVDSILGLLDGAVTGLQEEFDVAAEAKWILQEMAKEISEQDDPGD